MATKFEPLTYSEMVERLGPILRSRKNSPEERENEAYELLRAQDEYTERCARRREAEQFISRLEMIELSTKLLLEEARRHDTP